MRVRNAVPIALFSLTAVLGMAWQQGRMNPVVALLAQKNPVFGL